MTRCKCCGVERGEAVRLSEMVRSALTDLTIARVVALEVNAARVVLHLSRGTERIRDVAQALEGMGHG